jgi:hypothetical protein
LILIVADRIEDIDTDHTAGATAVNDDMMLSMMWVTWWQVAVQVLVWYCWQWQKSSESSVVAMLAMSARIAVVTRIVAAAAISDVMGAGWQWQQVAKTK